MSFIPDVDTPDVGVPDFDTPDVDTPNLDTPDFDAPNVGVPEFDTPDLSGPNFSAPSLPSFDAPDIGDIDAPDVDVPDSPEVDVPDVDVPDVPDTSPVAGNVPDLSDIDAPDVDVPDSPEVDVPDVSTPDPPDVSVPDLSVPDIGSPSVPDISVPDLSDIDAPDVDVPDSPEVDVPDFGDIGSGVEDTAGDIGEGVVEAGETVGSGAVEGGDLAQEAAFEDPLGDEDRIDLPGPGIGNIDVPLPGLPNIGIPDFGLPDTPSLGDIPSPGDIPGPDIPSGGVPGAPNFEIGELQFPEMTPLGEPYTINIPVNNTGDAPGLVEIVADGETQSANLEPGTGETFSFSFNKQDPGVTEHNFTFRVPDAGAEETFTIPVVGQTPSFSVGEPSFPEQVPVGEPLTVEIPVTNEGNAPGSPDISLNGETRDQEIEPGNTETFSWELTPESPGVTEYTASFTDPVSGSTETFNIPIAAAPPDVSIGQAAYPPQAPQGQEYQGQIGLVNAGTAPAEVTVEVGQTTETRTIPPGGSTVVTHTATNQTEDSAEYTITVTDAETGETLDQQTVTVGTLPAPPGGPGGPPQPPGPPDGSPFQPILQAVQYPSQAEPGSDYVGEIAVANVGPESGQVLVQAGNFSRAVTVDPGNSETVDHQTTMPSSGSDTYTVRVVSQQTGEEVSSQQVTVAPTGGQEQPTEPEQPSFPFDPPWQQPSQPPSGGGGDDEPIIVQPPGPSPPQPAPSPQPPAQPPSGGGDETTLFDLLNPLFPLQVLVDPDTDFPTL